MRIESGRRVRQGAIVGQSARDDARSIAQSPSRRDDQLFVSGDGL